MKLIPFASRTVEIELTAGQAIDRLRAIVAPRQLFRSTRSGKDFDGTLRESEVRLSPTYLRITLPGILPVVHCRFDHAAEKTSVILEQVPHPATMWVSAGLFALIGWCVYDIPYPTRTVLCLATVAWLLMIFGFWLDRGRSLKKLVAALSVLPGENLSVQ